MKSEGLVKVNRAIPRYVDEQGRKYELFLSCVNPECGYAITLGRLTKDWKTCPLCCSELKVGAKYY